MKKILLINWRDIQNPEAGGAETYYHELFRRLDSQKWDITVLTHRYSGSESTTLQDGLKVKRIGNKFTFNFSALLYVLRNKRRFDLVIEDLNKLPFFTPLVYRGKRLHLLMHLFGKTIFSEIHPLMALYIYVLEWLIGPLYRREHFIAISQSTRDELQRKCRKAHIHIVEPGIDTGFFYPSAPKANPPRICHVGRIKRYKNVMFLIESHVELLEEFPDLQLHIAGTGDQLEQCQRRARELGIEKNVVFYGYISEEKKRDLISSSLAFVNPSIKEGWGITTIEANMCGTIAICSNVAGLRDSVRDGATGSLFTLNDTASYVAAVRCYVSDERYRREIEQNAKHHGATYRWDNLARRLDTILSNHME